jgi:hypothetical protein
MTYMYCCMNLEHNSLNIYRRECFKQIMYTRMFNTLFLEALVFQLIKQMRHYIYIYIYIYISKLAYSINQLWPHEHN